MVEIVKGASISAPKAQQSNSRVNTQSGVSITTGEYIGSQSQAIKQLKNNVTSIANTALKNPAANMRQLIKADELRTTIPSKTYDEGYVAEKQLKQEMNEAEKAYKSAQERFNIDPITKDLAELGWSNNKKVQPYKEKYEAKKKEYEDFKKVRYYSAFPDGEVVSTNPKKAKYGSFVLGVDWTYEYINNINDAQTYIETKGKNSNAYPLFHKYSFMTDREIGIYNYIYAEQGAKEATEFLKFLEEDLDARETKKIAKDNSKFAKEHPYLSAAASVATNLAASGEHILNSVDYAITGNLKTNKAAMSTSILRGALPEKVDWEIGKWDAFDFVYNTTMSGVDSLVVAPTGTVGAVTLGLSAAANSTNDILERGGTNEQAFWGGIAAGAFEGFFEKFSIGQLKTMQEGTVTGLKDFAKNLGKSMLTNASEETATEVANVLYDYATNGGISQYAMLVEEYMQDPKIDEKTAKKKAAQKLGLQILEAGASGALMGFGFGSLGSAVGYSNYKNSLNKERITLEEFANRNSEIWRNVDYSDNDTKTAIMNETHNRMVAEGNVVKVSKETQEKVGESYPDLRSMKKKERTPILKEAMDTLKNNLRQFLNGFKNQGFEFEVNGKVLEATLYNTGINEVLEKITQEKANMLYSTDEIFKNSCYLYSTPDYDGDPNVYRWNYFYTPVQIGEETVGVRIAVRDLAKQGESQIYNWGIKKDVSLDGVGDDLKNRKSNDVSSDTSFNPTIPQNGSGVNNNIPDSTENNFQNSSGGVDDIASFGDIDTVKGKHLNKAQQEEIREIGEKLGRKVIYEDFYELDKFKGKKKIPDGYIDKDGNIHINFYAKRPVYFIFKHEITHYLKRALPAYTDFMDMAFNSKAFSIWLHSKGYSSINEFKAEIMDTYSEVRGFDETKCYDEILADFVGGRLFGGERAINAELMNALEPKHKKSFLDVIKNIIDYLKSKFSENAKVNYEINRIEKEFIKVYNEAVNVKENSNSDGEVSYSIKKSTDGHKFVQVENKTISDTDSAKDIATTLSNIIKNKFNDFVNVSGQKIGVNSRTAREWQRSKDAQYLLANEKQKYTDKINAFNNADELLKAARNYIGEEIKHQRSDNFVEFARGIVDFKVDDRGYSADIIVGTTKSGVALLYDIVGLQEIEIEDASHTAQDRRAETSSTDIIDDIEPTVKKNSMQETDDYSIPVDNSAESLLEQYENGEITRQEYLDMVKKQKPLNPAEIANLTEEDANTTPHHSRKKGESDGDKESKFYGSLLESDIFDERFKDEVRDDSFIQKYKSVTNKETLEKAAKELDEGGQSYVNQWWNKDPEHASLIDTAVGFILMDRYQRVGDYESAAAAAERVRAFGTAGGQQVQIFSILGRLEPNAMVLYAQKQLDKAFEELAEIKTQKWIDKNADKLKLTEDDIELIRRYTLQAALFDDNTRPKAIALGKICNIIQDKIPPEAGQSIRALQRSNMLLNLKTILRNINGNVGMTPLFIASDFFGTAIDKAVSKKTEYRSTGMYGHVFTKDGRERLKESTKSFGKGVYESWDDFKRGIRTKQEDLNRFELNASTGKNFNEHHNGKLGKQLDAIAKALNKMDNFTSFCLEVGDRPFFEMWMTNSLNNQLRLNNLEIPTPEMIEVAKQEALQRTWQDDNKLTRSASKIKSALNDMVHIPGTSYGLGDFVMKFIKTPSNIAKAIGSFSPVGFVSAGVNAKKLKNAIDKGKFNPQLQREFVRSMSNAITGTTVYALVAIGAALGVVKLSGDDDDDKDASNYEKYIMGIPPYSIEFFGVNVTYDWAQPFGSILAVVADFMESQEENPDGDVANAIVEAIKAGGKAFSQQSFLQSLYDLFSSEDIVEALTTAALAEPAAFVPQRWSQTASYFDEYRRTSYDNTNSFKSAINKVIAKIPGLRTTLPNQVNVLGEEVKNTQYLDEWEAFASPWNTYPKSSGEVVGEIYKLYKSTGENSVIPRTAPNYFTVKGNKMIFTPEEKADFQRNTGKYSAELLGQLFDSQEYTKLSDDEKVAAISKIYQFAYDKVKSERKYDYDTLSAMVGEKKNGDPILTKSVYSKMREQDLEELAQEYFLSKAEMRFLDDYDKLIQYYINQVKN